MLFLAGQKYILRLLQGLKGLFVRIVSFWSVVPRVKSFPANKVSLRKCSQVFETILSRPNKTQRLCYTNDNFKEETNDDIIFSHPMLAFSLRVKIITFINRYRRFYSKSH